MNKHDFQRGTECQVALMRRSDINNAYNNSAFSQLNQIDLPSDISQPCDNKDQSSTDMSVMF